VVILASEERVHEMLCRSLAIEFDNRMLQVKKQLRVGACGLVRSFPLLYSVIIREKLCGQTNADSPTAGHRRPEQRNQEATTHRKQLLNP
jgi:hypothetical protein